MQSEGAKSDEGLVMDVNLWRETETQNDNLAKPIAKRFSQSVENFLTLRTPTLSARLNTELLTVTWKTS